MIIKIYIFIQKESSIAVPLKQNGSILVTNNQSGISSTKPSILITGSEISKNLLSIVQLKFGNQLWTIAWQTRVSLFKYWRINARNIDSFDIHPTELFDLIEKSTLQLLYMMIIEECYQLSIQSGNIDCFSMDYSPVLRADIVNPLLQSYIANTTACVQTKFYLDHFEMQIGGTASKNRSTLVPESSTEIIGFEVNLCH